MFDSLARRIDAGFQALPDSNRWFETLFARTWLVVMVILAMTILTRASVFGDPNNHVDEAYYFLIGQRLQVGEILYVDIWDRKPPGLYIIYRYLAEISHDFWIVHLAAGASAAATAFLIYRISLLIALRQGAILAALSYLLLLPKFGGAGGQSPVFYNLPMALAVWLILNWHGKDRSFRAELLAMFFAGCALTIKQTVLFEGAAMGLWLVWRARSAGLDHGKLALRTLQLALCGALPTLAYITWYAVNGHLDILWQSIVGSNLDRDYNPEGNHGYRLGFLIGQTGLPFGVALLAIVLNWQRCRTDRVFAFLVGWVIVALAAFLVVPNKFDFYLLPLFLPLSIVGALFYARRDFGLATFICVAVAFLTAGKCFDFEYHRQSRQEMQVLVDAVRSSDKRPTLLVYGEPVFLYAMTDIKPPLELPFPTHLFDPAERNASPFNTEKQVQKALATKPSSVVAEFPINIQKINENTDEQIRSYVSRCKSRRPFPLRNMYGAYRVFHYSGCGKT